MQTSYAGKMLVFYPIYGRIVYLLKESLFKKKENIEGVFFKIFKQTKD